MLVRTLLPIPIPIPPLPKDKGALQHTRAPAGQGTHQASDDQHGCLTCSSYGPIRGTLAGTLLVPLATSEESPV